MEIKLYQIDVKSAFLNGYLKEEVYVMQPLGFESKEFPNDVFKLGKALYGLKQTLRGNIYWLSKYMSMTLYLVQLRMTCATNFVKMMRSEFEMSMMGEPNFFLGLQIKQTSNDTMIRQQKYVKELLKRFEMDSAKLIDTPISPSTSLVMEDGSLSIEEKSYRGMIGTLL